MKSSCVFIVLALSTVCLWSQTTAPQAPAPSPDASSPAKPGQTAQPAPQTATPAPMVATPGLTLRGPEAIAQQDPSRVVAVIGGTPVTASQAAELLKPVRPDDKKKFAGHYDKLLQELYMQQQFAELADTAHLGDQQPWKDQLKVARENVLIQAYITMISNQPGIAPDAKGYYESHPTEFENTQLSGILIRFLPPGAPPPAGATDPSKVRTEEQAKAKAEQLESKLKGGADFAALAKSDSDDPASAARGGEIGSYNLANNALSSDIKAVMTNLKPGEVSEPIKQGAGYYILKVTGHTKTSFDQAQADILRKMQGNRSSEALKKEFEKYAITVKDPQFFDDGTPAAPKIPSLASPTGASGPASSAPPPNK